MTTEQATSLKNTLEVMMNKISQKETVIEQLTQIGRLQEEISPTAPAELKHYLQNRSYTKALQYLNTGFVIEDPDRPDCDEDHP